MLGRLFKHNSTSANNNINQTHTPLPQPSTILTSQSASPPISTPFEDSHSREILYGTCNANSLKPFQFNSKYFRIIISQDGGNLRSKEILFDSAYEVIQQQQQQQQCTSPLQSPLHSESRRTSLKKSTSTTNQRIYHNTTDLNDLSFGCGLPTNEVQTITKLHTLPPITNSSTSYHAVLITRLFSISNAEVSTVNANFQQQGNSDYDCWEPKSATTSKEPRVTNFYDLKLNSRFSIGVVIPLESGNFIHEDIINEWSEISHFLTLLQKLVYRKLILHLNSVIDKGNGCEYLVKKRLQFPNHILQNDFELHGQLGKLIKLIHYDDNTPRLINTNYFIKLNKKGYNSSLMNWILETLNWFEFKDGRCNTNSNMLFNNPNADKNPSFLATLMSLLMQYRKSLGSRPYYNDSSNNREATRVVVMTGNPAVAKRLIFILNGLIANTESAKCGDSNQFVLTHTDEGRREGVGVSQSDDGIEDENQSVDDEWNSPSTLTNSVITERETLNGHTHEVSRVQPSAVSIPINRPKSSQAPTIGIPINTPTTSQASSSLSKSASLAQLSTSLNSSYSSLQSNYSSSKFGAAAGSVGGGTGFSSGSFVEKWKNSFTNQQHTSSGNMGGYFDEPPSLGMRKSSHQSLRTPSPAFEHDDFNWQSSSYTNSIASPMSMTPSKISRTQSLYDLYDLGMNSMSEEQLSESSRSSSSSTGENHTQTSQHHHGNSNNNNTNSSVFEVKRSKTSVYTPFVSDRLVKNVAEYNRSTIQAKCKQIMDDTPKCVKQGDAVLEVASKVDERRSSLDKPSSGETTDNSDTSTNNTTTTPLSPRSTIFKHNILLPCVGYCDEFRPEFILQSCPINPKLEPQVMSSMKNDLIYYQNNYKYSKITTRTIFVNLRAREIKTIEMNIDNEKTQQQQQQQQQVKQVKSQAELSKLTNDQFKKQSESQDEENTRGENRASIGASCMSTSTSTSTSSASSPTSTSYKTKIHKIYSPLKCAGEKRLILRIESILDSLDELFKIQQQLSYQQHHSQQSQSQQQQLDKKQMDKRQFHDKLMGLVAELID